MGLSLRSRPISLVAAAGLVAIAAAGSLSLSTTAHATPISLVRIDQVGYLPSDAKHAYLMASGPVGHATWDVVDRNGKVVEHGKVGTSNRGPWNANYPDVYDITFSGLTKLGTYHLHVHGDVAAASPSFEVETASDLFGQLVKDGVNFFQVQRDGANVITGDLNRQPAHLADAHATVYEHPLFVDASQSDSTLPGVDLKKVTTGPTKVDAEGGWYDAADFLKFTHTNAYGDVLLYASQRALGGAAPATLKNEAQFGETFLDKMWSMSTKTLYSQVGIGGDNGDDTHDPTFSETTTSGACRRPTPPTPTRSTATPRRTARCSARRLLVSRSARIWWVACRPPSRSLLRSTRRPTGRPGRVRVHRGDLALRDGRHREPAGSAGHCRPVRLLPGELLARRHGTRRCRDRARFAVSGP